MSTLTPARRLAAPVMLPVATAGGLVAGILTSYLQGVLPGNWGVLANSGAVWTLVAFALALLCVEHLWTAVAAGALALVGEVAGYYAIASPVRGIASSPSELVLWTCAALVLGPPAGLAARWSLRGTPTERVVGVLAVCGVPAGEGLYSLSHIPGHAIAGRVELATALAVGVVAIVSGTGSWRGRLLAVTVGIVVTIGVALVYTAPLLL